MKLYVLIFGVLAACVLTIEAYKLTDELQPIDEAQPIDGPQPVQSSERKKRCLLLDQLFGLRPPPPPLPPFFFPQYQQYQPYPVQQMPQPMPQPIQQPTQGPAYNPTGFQPRSGW